jgi:hypothetical protein
MKTQDVERKFNYATEMKHYNGGLYKFMFDHVKVHKQIDMYRNFLEHDINHVGTSWALGMYVAKHTETGDILMVWKDGFNEFHCHLIEEGPNHKDIIGEELVVYLDSDNGVWARPREMFYEYLEGKGCYRFEIINNSDSLSI